MAHKNALKREFRQGDCAETTIKREFFFPNRSFTAVKTWFLVGKRAFGQNGGKSVGTNYYKWLIKTR